MNSSLFFILLSYTAALYFLKVYIYCYACWEYFVHLLEANDLDDIYDYVIVGCGTAGSLIAHHLSSQKHVKFLVLEAGGNGGPLLNPPALGPMLQQTSHDWQYKTVRQKNACLSMIDQKCRWPMGKIIGGSARLNNMIHVRNYIEEIAEWFDNEFSIYELDNYLKDLEKHDLPFEILKFKSPLSNAILTAADELGYNVNSNSKLGFMDTFVNQKNGARWTTSHTLFENLIHHPNIKILSHAHAEKIIIDPETKVAKSVQYERYGRKSVAIAKKGVILSSGAIGTPKLLLLSGVGPRSHLEHFGIDVIQDLPVGENLIDHVSTGLDLILLNSSINVGLSDLMDPLNLWYYYKGGVGLWTTSGCETVAFLQTSNNSADSLADLQLMVLPVGISTDHGIQLRNAIGINDQTWDTYFSKVTSNNAITILPIVLHPKSKGTVRLLSSNPLDPPLIDPRYFSNKEDVEVMLRGIEVVKKLLATKSMVDLGASLNDISFPGCKKHPFDTKDYWVCYVRHLTLTTYHPAGTCRMGPINKTDTVVGYDFKVKGIKNLFVSDASLFPSLPSGNINTAVALMAKIFSQKISDIKNIPN